MLNSFINSTNKESYQIEVNRIKKHFYDFGFVIGHYYGNYRNQEYVANAELHTSAYMNALNGLIFGGKY